MDIGQNSCVTLIGFDPLQMLTTLSLDDIGNPLPGRHALHTLEFDTVTWRMAFTSAGQTDYDQLMHHSLPRHNNKCSCTH